MRTQTARNPVARTIHHSIEKVVPGADFAEDDNNWTTYNRSRVPILWQDDSEDDGLESDLKFDAVFEAASEWDSSRN